MPTILKPSVMDYLRDGVALGVGGLLTYSPPPVLGEVMGVINTGWIAPAIASRQHKSIVRVISLLFLVDRLFEDIGGGRGVM